MQNFGGTTKSILIFLRKRPIEQKMMIFSVQLTERLSCFLADK